VKIENPAALRFIMQDEIYLLNKDKMLYQADEAPLTIEAPQTIKAVTTIEETLPVSFNYLGGHKKNFLVIVHYSEPEFIDEKHLTALESILKRLEFSLEDVAILNRANYANASFEVLIGFFKPKKLLVLGKNSLPAGIEPLTLNSSRQLNNCNALYSFSFDEMMDSNENKKAFWEQMKQL
jgi:hypothetical protein